MPRRKRCKNRMFRVDGGRVLHSQGRLSSPSLLLMGEQGRNLIEKGGSFPWLPLHRSQQQPPLPRPTAPLTLWLESWFWHLPCKLYQVSIWCLTLTVKARIKFTLFKHLKYSAKVSREAQLFEFWLMFMIANKMANRWSINLKLSI